MLRDIYGFMREPYGIHLRFLCLAGFISHPSFKWAVAFIVASFCTFLLIGMAVAASSSEGASDFIYYFETNPDISSLDEFPLPEDTNWYSRFHLWVMRLKADRYLSKAQPLRIFNAKFQSGGSMTSLKSFINPYGTSIILVRHGPLENIKPVQRFTLYHELAHCSIAGITLWSRKHGMPASALLGAVTATAFAPRPSQWLVLTIGLIYWLLTLAYWKYRRDIMLEFYADSYAMKRLAEESFEAAKSAGSYWLKTWNDELNAGSSRWPELKARIFEMKHSLRCVERWMAGKIVVMGMREDPSTAMVITDYAFLIVCVIIGWKSSDLSLSFSIVVVIIVLWFAWRAHLAVRHVARCQLYFMSKLLPKYTGIHK